MNEKPSARRSDPYLLLALCVGLLAVLPLLIGPGIVNTRAGGDSPFLLQRVQGIVENLRAGSLPARWMADGAHGLGYPAYVYYAALPYYVAALLSEIGLGVLWGIKLTQTLVFLLAAATSYLLARELGARRTGALLASVMYTAAPFHLVNAYVRGDSLSELTAMALFPTLLWLLRRLAQRPRAARAAALAVAYAALMLSHNISALLFSPLLGLWLLCEIGSSARERRWHLLLSGGGALALGLLLSAWFWLPALGETDLVQLGDQTSGYFHFAGHFRGLNLVQPSVIHDYSIGDGRDPFSMGLVQAILTLLGLGAVVWSAIRRRRLVWEETLLALALLVSTWLITPSSRWVWEHLPLLDYAQFPWRWLSVQALMGALLLPRIEALWSERSLDRWLSLAAAALLLLGGLAGLRVDRLPIVEDDVTPERLMLYETYSGNIGGTVRYEYLPLAMVPRPHVSGLQLGQADTPLVLQGSLSSAKELLREPERQQWRIEVTEASLLAFQSSDHPGWVATVDGIEQATEPLPGLGLIGLRLAPGEHEVSLRYRGTPLQRASRVASLLGLLVWIGLLVWSAQRDRALRPWLIGGAALLVALFAVPRLTPQGLATASQESGVWLMDWVRAPYWHLEPDGVRFEDLALLEGGIGPVNVEPGETVALDLTFAAADPEATLCVEMMAASDHLYPPRLVRLSVEQPLDSAELSLSIALPSDLPPGLYVLRLNVDRAGQDLEVTTAEGFRMGRLMVGVLQCVGHRMATGEEPPIAQYGPEDQEPVIALLSADAQVEGKRAYVDLAWRSERQVPLNYFQSVRLLDAQGELIADRDMPLFYGGYPTSLWQPGELLSDLVRIDIDPAQADDIVAVEVVLYDRLSMDQAGSARVAIY